MQLPALGIVIIMAHKPLHTPNSTGIPPNSITGDRYAPVLATHPTGEVPNEPDLISETNLTIAWCVSLDMHTISLRLSLSLFLSSPPPPLAPSLTFKYFTCSPSQLTVWVYHITTVNLIKIFILQSGEVHVLSLASNMTAMVMIIMPKNTEKFSLPL